MRSPIEIFRSALAAYVTARARAERALAMGAGADDGEVLALGRARRALGSGEPREALESSASYIEPAEHGASLALLARAAREEIAARRGVPWRSARDVLRVQDVEVVRGEARSLGSLAIDALAAKDGSRRAEALDALGSAITRGASARHEAADEGASVAARIHARGPAAPDAGPAGAELATLARTFLDATDDAMREAMARAAHGTPFRDPRTVEDALAVLRAPAVDPLVAPRERTRRLASFLAPLGLDSPLSSRARMDATHPFVAPDPFVIALDGRVVIAPSPLEVGLATELGLARAVGAALGPLLGAPALPIALRARPWGSVPLALGDLVAWLHVEPLFLRRARGLDGAALEALRRAAIALVLVRARVLASRISIAGDARERRERGAEALVRALGVEDATMPAGIADPGPIDLDHPAALRAAMAVPAIVAVLRERFDEDWFRNPRAAEPLRAAASRGLGLSIEAWTAELGATAPLAIAAIVEAAR